MTKRLVKWTGKALLAGLLAFALLCGFCLLYYNVPVHYPNPDGATEYKWEAHRFYSKGTEGFALGRTNNDGFNNLLDYRPGMPIDILLMGSSHMEGFNVAQDENAAAVLNALYAGERCVYNIGTAGHTLLHCVKRLDRALEFYAPARFVVIETSTLNYTAAELLSAADGTLPDIPSHTGGLLSLLQHLPYLRLLYTKYVRGAERFGDVEDSPPAAADASPADFGRALDALLAKLGGVSAAHGVVPVLVYDPTVFPCADGSCTVMTDPARLEAFRAGCEARGVLFVDLTAPYLRAASEGGTLPYGFSNTSPGGGHMNRIGHRLFAEAVYAALAEAEG